MKNGAYNMDLDDDIVIGNESTIAELNEIATTTKGRLSILDIKNNYAHIRYRNYYRTAGGNRSKDDNGAWKLLPIIDKWVKLI